MQSAAAAVLATGGAALARAQYARTVRPALGSFGRVRPDLAPNDQLAWVCHLFNGGQEVVVIEDIRYHVAYTSAGHAGGATDTVGWAERRTALESIEGAGLVSRADFYINFVSSGHPVPAQHLVFLGWCTEKSMRVVESVLLKARVTDRVGDAHERVIDLLKGADRAPSLPDPPAPF
ncbi:hypothetical protein [Streptomyces sp. NPDC098781]|uniref:hypothetical protein n=1 Tax=Streptomyces sp. NPDC098781 TaxID=3366097 RepID=UPI00382C4DFA